MLITFGKTFQVGLQAGVLDSGRMLINLHVSVDKCLLTLISRSIHLCKSSCTLELTSYQQRIRGVINKLLTFWNNSSNKSNIRGGLC